MRSSYRAVLEWQFSWLEYRPVTPGVAGSSPVHSAMSKRISR